MAYFNHAFQKLFVGTTQFQTTAGAATTSLSIGEFTFVDPKTWLAPADLAALSPTTACPLVLVSGSIHPNDKIGKFHGGYSETVKSKTINPKYVSAFYKVVDCEAQQAQITVGANYDNYAAGRPNFGDCNPNSGTVLNKTFLCGENYDLRVDIKGSPALRFLTRNDYFTATAYTGCCPDDSIAPTPVNPLVVYIQWAYMLLNSPLINPFIEVQVTYSSNNGTDWNEIGDGTSSADNLADLLGYIQGTTAIPGNATPEDTLAGLIITGAYEDTRFGDCTFYPNDSIIAFLEPVKIYASEVDNNGDPCAFGGVCVNNTCEALQLKGTGENVIRDLILTEGYMQQPFYTGQDLRIREITNGTDVYDAINRNTLYTRYYIQHNVPRFNNPSGTFDNDQYLLEIIVDAGGTSNLTQFENFVQAWLDNAGSGCTTLTTYACPSYCDPVPATYED